MIADLAVKSFELFAKNDALGKLILLTFFFNFAAPKIKPAPL
jgi:hypothetical protein